MKKWTCRKVRLNAGGYEYGKWGKYYGHGAPLWSIQDPEEGRRYMLRSGSRKDAILSFCVPCCDGLEQPKPEDFYVFKR